MKKVAIFGSARTSSDTELYAAVERLGQRCAQSGWTVVTGGGPGTMEAANKGAARVNLTMSEAEAIYLPFEEAVNEYVHEYTKHDNFFSRLDTFSNCDAFIVTPGGIGTLLEMAMIYQLVQVEHIEAKPIICVGRMWRTLKDWLEHEMVDNGFLSNKEMDYIHYVDRFGEAIHLLNGLSKD